MFRRIKTEIQWWAGRLSERIPRNIAYMLPRSIVYWCAIRVASHATSGQYSNQVVPELTAMDALKRWDTCSQ